MTHLRHKPLAAFAFDEIVLSDALEEKERAIRRPFVRNEMCSAGGNLVAVSDFKRVLIIGITCIYGERGPRRLGVCLLRAISGRLDCLAIS